MANETPQFFTNRAGKRLFGILHEGEAARAHHGVAVVYCAPLFEEKLWSHRVVVNLARFMAGQGVSTLRFDYYGDGESEGDFEEASVASRVADIVDAARFCLERTQARRLYLLGLCYGGTLAVKAASECDAVDGAVAWAPVIHGERYMSDLLRGHLTTQMVLYRKIIHDREALVGQIKSGRTVNVEGYEIGEGLYSQALALDLPQLLRDATKPMLVEQISPAEDFDPQVRALQSSASRHVQFRRAREMKFWVQQKKIFPPCTELFEHTAEWISSVAAAAP